MPPYKPLPIFWVYHINVECMWNHLILQNLSSHLPERASHSSDKAPLALHIEFQIFCAFLICQITPSARATYSPEIQPTISHYLSAMKGRSVPCYLPTHTAQNSWKAHSLWTLPAKYAQSRSAPRRQIKSSLRCSPHLASFCRNLIAYNI